MSILNLIYLIHKHLTHCKIIQYSIVNFSTGLKILYISQRPVEKMFNETSTLSQLKTF